MQFCRMKVAVSLAGILTIIYLLDFAASSGTDSRLEESNHDKESYCQTPYPGRKRNYCTIPFGWDEF